MGEPIIKVSNGAVYQGQTLVLDRINVELAAGEMAYLIGKTGSGKSSFLKLLYGELPLDKGEGNVVNIDLNTLKQSKVHTLRRKLGIVFQDFQLLTDRTVYKNLEFVLRATGWTDSKLIQSRIDECLGNVGLKTKDFKMPHELSGGEQQRIVIARALLNHPELILADEPTGNLDPETSDEIMSLLRKINREIGTALLIATHDYSLIEKFPSRILKVVNGSIVESEDISILQSN
ncbi:MAG: ATP-binding cassette domain-containing protein [Chitinophagales bacterium]|nr:ATP-binding cassette domain-containing protein [Chitinophagales bacterium]